MVFADDVYLAPCPHCGSGNPFQVRAEPAEVTFITPRSDGNPQKETVVPGTVHMTERACLKCGKTFSLMLSPGGSKQVLMGTHKRIAFAQPEQNVSAGVMVWDTNSPHTGTDGSEWVYVTSDGKRLFRDGKLFPMDGEREIP
jgi:hypothetical protein